MPCDLLTEVRRALIQAGFLLVAQDAGTEAIGLSVIEAPDGALVRWTVSDGSNSCGAVAAPRAAVAAALANDQAFAHRPQTLPRLTTAAVHRHTRGIQPPVDAVQPPDTSQ